MASTITSFSSASSTTFTVDGQTVYTDNANKSWSLTEPDANTLQFSVHAGDNWASAGWSDAVNDGGANRSEVQFEQLYSAGTQINVSETLTVQPGPTNTASFLSFNQLHATTGSPPAPFYLGLDTSDHLIVVLQGPNGYYNEVYRSPNPIVRGQPMDLNFQLNMGPSGGGYVGVWLDGTQIVNYHGVVGATGSQYYLKEGIYRGPAAETLTADFSNVQITTGAQAAPTGGTTSSSGTTTGASSGGTTVTAPAGGTTGSTSTGSTSSGSSTTSGGTSSGSTTVTNPTGSTSSSSTSGSSTTTPTKPVAPTITVADHNLSVSPGGSVSLGLGVSVPHAGDNVSVTISGLPTYETITDKLDGKTFSGSSVTLSAAEVNSGLTLSSSFSGSGHPTSTLTVTAHDATGTPITSAAQTITVVDPPATTTSSGSSATSSSASTTTSEAGTSSGQSIHSWNPRGVATSLTSSGSSTTTSGQAPVSRTNFAQWFSDHAGFAPVASTLSEAGASRSISLPSVATTSATPTPSAGATAYALLNQMMARDFGGESHFAQTATALSTSSQQQASLLTRPLH
jgi:hypothetical protein